MTAATTKSNVTLLDSLFQICALMVWEVLYAESLY